MVWWVTLLWYIGATIVTELLRPKPNLENARPAGLGDFNFPTSQEGRVIPVGWGTFVQAGPNLVWFGDLQTIAITEKIKTGLFSSDTIVKGFRYFVGMQLALIRGELTSNGVDGIRRAWVDDKLVRDGTGSPGTFSPVNSGDISISKIEFNGEESDLIGTLEVVSGSATQAVNSYLTGVVAGGAAELPAYRGTAYVLWKGGEIGTSPNLQPWKFEITRIPDGLSLGGSPSMAKILEDDVVHANPMNVLYEILTDTDWGASVSTSLIDTTSFIAAATQLHSEGNGFSMLLDNPKQIGKVIEEIERQVDGSLLLDEQTGKYEFLLAREVTDSPDVTPLVDESNCVKLDFSRTSWEDTMNEVRVPYHDPQKEYAESFAMATDGANFKIQGGSNLTTTMKFPGCKQGSLATKLAWRELRFVSYPLSKITVVVDRTFFALKPTEVIDVTWAPLGISNVRYRVSKIEAGEMENGLIKMDAIEDIFQTEIATFSNPITSRWVPFSSDPASILFAKFVELPTEFKTVEGTQVAVMAVPANSFQSFYDVYIALNPGGSPILNTVADDFSFSNRITRFTPSGLSVGSILASSSPPATITVDGTNDIDDVIALAGSPFPVVGDVDSTNLVNLILIDDEWIFFETIAEGSPAGSYILSGLTRGMFGSTIAAHSDDVRVWFASFGIGKVLPNNETFALTDVNFAVRLLSGTPSGTENIDLAFETSFELAHITAGSGSTTGSTADQVSLNFELKTVSAQPGSPANGDTYVIGASATGTDWGGSPEKENWIAEFSSASGWTLTPPQQGWTVFDTVTSRRWEYNGTEWEGLSAATFTHSGSPTTFEPDLEHSNSTIILDGSGTTINIPDNATQGFSVGRTLRFINDISAGSPDEIVITDDASVTYIGTDPTSGTLAPGSILELEKSNTDEWIVLRNGP
jgi:hypothetical protein